MRSTYLLIASVGLSLISIPVAFSQVQICDIRYSDQGLEKQELRSRGSLSNPWEKICQQIGVEHDEMGKPNIDKPIFACCRDGIGEELNFNESD